MRSRRVLTPRSAPGPRCCTSRGCGRSTTPPTTACTCATPTATTSRPSATALNERRPDPQAPAPCSTATAPVRTRARRCASIRTSGCGTPALHRHRHKAASTHHAPPTSCHALFPGQWDNGMLPHMIFARRLARRGGPTAALLARCWRVRARHATSPPRASRSHRSSPSRSSTSPLHSRRTRHAFVARAEAARLPPLALPRASGSTATPSSRSLTRGSAGSTPRRRG